MKDATARGGAQEGREVELKLAIDPGRLDDVAKALARRAGKRARKDALHSTYYDTPGQALRKAGVTLRVRRIGERRIQTVKAGEAQAGLFDRPEWEAEIEGDEPELARAKGTALEPLLDGKAGKLRPVFRVEVERTAYRVKMGESRIEAALDRGTISAGKRTASVSEVELELKRGVPADLFALARELADEFPLRVGHSTKAERGYRLREGKPDKPAKATPPKLRPGMTAGEAFQVIGRSCLRHLLANEPLLREARDPEAVHQMRVAMRRLRAAMSIFKRVVADERSDTVRNELRALAGELGEARDIDVLLEKTIAPARQRHPDEADLAALAEAYEERREAAYDKAIEGLESGRFARTVLDAAGWIETGPWLAQGTSAAARDEPAEAFAAKELARRAKRIRKRGKHIEELEPEARHELRIAVKKLRYACEFFAPLFPGTARMQAQEGVALGARRSAGPARRSQRRCRRRGDARDGRARSRGAAPRARPGRAFRRAPCGRDQGLSRVRRGGAVLGLSARVLAERSRLPLSASWPRRRRRSCKRRPR